MSEPIHINRRRQAPVRNRRPAPTPKKHGLFGGSKKSTKRPAQKAVKKGGLFGKKKINKQFSFFIYKNVYFPKKILPGQYFFTIFLENFQ